MVPVGMGYKYLGVYGSFWQIILNQIVTQRSYACAGIDYYAPLIFTKP